MDVASSDYDGFGVDARCAVDTAVKSFVEVLTTVDTVKCAAKVNREDEEVQ